MKKKKCSVLGCRKKQLVLFECKCNLFFCNLHIYSDKHNCGFDHKKSHKDFLTTKNKKIVAEKINKI